MKNTEMTYGALSAKIRALYGKHLRADDFVRLAGLKNEAELLETLRQHPGWSCALSLVPPGTWSYVGRVEMEGALRDEPRLEYQSLSYYVPREDKPLMQFQLRTAERSALLTALRRLKTSHYAKESSPMSAVPLRLRLGEGALASCTSYDQFLDIARDIIYVSMLRHLRPSRDDALPDSTLAKAALRTAYLSHLYRTVHCQYTGRTQKVLLRTLGEQIDLLNIIHVFRLKTYFPQTEPGTYLRVLFPFHYRLSPGFTRAFCAAPGVDDVFALLRGSPYRDCFNGVAVGAVEEYHQRAICRFNKRQLATVPPSIYTAVAYLELKELELSVLISVIESVRYGVPYRVEFADLVGQQTPQAHVKEGATATSVVPMKLLAIAGPLERFDDVVRACAIDQGFHPEDALQLMRSVKGLRPLELENPYSVLFHRSVEVADEAGILLAYAPFDPASPLEGFTSYFDSLSGRIATLHRRREELEHKADEVRSIVDQLQNLRGLNASLDELWGLDHTQFRYGYLPWGTYDGFREAPNEEEDIFFVPTTLGARRVYRVYFTAREAHHKVDSLPSSLHFVHIRLEDPPGGTVDNATTELNAQVETAQTAVAQVGQELEELRRQEREHILSSYSYLRYHSECCGLRQYACRDKGTFYFTGWVPAAAVPEIEKTLARSPNLSCIVDTADDVRHIKPLTKLKTCFLGRVFQPFLEIYGLPAYNEKDPSLFMTLTYYLFFGIMFDDLGQGLCLVLIGFILARWKGMWLGGIITCCDLSGVLFGCVYGSVLGFEDILPGFKIMEEATFAGLGVMSNVPLLLVLSICLDVFMLLLVMAINILNDIHQKNYEKILSGPSGVAGIVFYAGLLTATVSTLAFGVSLFTPAYVLPVLILPSVLMLLREPLSHLLAKNPRWREFSVDEVLGTGFSELFETLLSYLTNTLSFMRVGAHAITHVGLMLVVHMLADLAGGMGGPTGILILVLGNAFVMGLEGLLVGVQVLRLESYELFGRFYDDGGTPFVPKKIDYATRTNG